jgi:uncharacterized protein YjbJ (UPF0337 family)
MSAKEITMNWDQVQGKWKQMKGEVKTKWGKLTDDDLDVAAGQKDKLVGRIQERYGIAKDEAERQVDDWNRSLDEKKHQQQEQQRTERKAS